MTSVVGHVFNLDFAPEYQNWEKTDDSATLPVLHNGFHARQHFKANVFTLSIAIQPENDVVATESPTVVKRANTFLPTSRR